MDLSLTSININKTQSPSQEVRSEASLSDKTNQKTGNIVVQFFKWVGLTLELKSLKRQEKKLGTAMAQAALNSNPGGSFDRAFKASGPVQNEIARLEKVLADFWRA